MKYKFDNVIKNHRKNPILVEIERELDYNVQD